MILTAIYLLICWLSPISVDLNIFMPLIIIEGILLVTRYVHEILKARYESKYKCRCNDKCDQ